MSFNKTDLVINLVAIVVGLTVGIIVNVITNNLVLSLFTGFVFPVIGMFIDLRISLHEITRQPEPPLFTSYSKLSNDSCQLFRKVAKEKYAEVDAYFAKLMNDVIELDSLSRVYEILEFLFCNLLSIEEIYATSYGELSEWRDADSWWGGNYLRIHDTAFKRGAKITRTVIFDSEKEKEAAQDVLDGNLDHKVIVKTALVRHIVSSDLERVGNCLIFLDSKKQPIYCLLATHNREGKFVRALIYRDQEHMKLILDAYNRIDGIAAFYQGGLKPVPTTTKLSQ